MQRDIVQQTVSETASIIKYLNEKGYKILRLDACVGRAAIQPGTGLPGGGGSSGGSSDGGRVPTGGPGVNLDPQPANKATSISGLEFLALTLTFSILALI